MNLKHTKSWLDPHILTQLRTTCVMNSNLAVAFDKLHLENLLPFNWLISSKHYNDTIKAKADVIEAVLGELADAKPELASQLVSYIAYIGETKFHAQNPVDEQRSPVLIVEAPSPKPVKTPSSSSSSSRVSRREAASGYVSGSTSSSSDSESEKQLPKPQAATKDIKPPQPKSARPQQQPTKTKASTTPIPALAVAAADNLLLFIEESQTPQRKAAVPKAVKPTDSAKNKKQVSATPAAPVSAPVATPLPQQQPSQLQAQPPHVAAGFHCVDVTTVGSRQVRVMKPSSTCVS